MHRLLTFRPALAFLFALFFALSDEVVSAGEDGLDADRMQDRWIWTELIAFDNEQPDLGVDQYLQLTGFVPDAICLLLGSPDFVLTHPGMEKERDLPTEYCSRDGHEFNRERSRQQWTNFQLRSLIANLHKRDVEVHVSMFAKYYRDKTHHEWISDHREVLQVWKDHGMIWSLNCLARTKDGSYFEEIFARKMVETLQDYGFDGWHGADGFGPLSGSVYLGSFSDDMVDQFITTMELQLPEVVTQECGHEVAKLKPRGDWILRHKRAEWIEFHAQRWERFWTTMVTALHGAQKKAVINSGWGRAPWEALYRYGIDYQRIAKTGVDAIIVETVAASLAMDSRLGRTDRHDDFLSMLLLMRAALPDTKLIYLQTVHDVVESYDAIHHIPQVLEREIYSLSNIFHTRPNGELRSGADGFLVCLGDGLHRRDWEWLGEGYQLGAQPLPKKIHGATLLWSDAAYRAQMTDFLKNRTWNTHRLIYHLMGDGATIQSSIDVGSLAKASGTLLVPNPQLLPKAELEKVMQYKAGPIVFIGRNVETSRKPDFSFSDVYQPNEMHCTVYGSETKFDPVKIAKDGEEVPLGDLGALIAPRSFWDHLSYRKVSPDFIKASAEILQKLSTPITVSKDSAPVALMPVEMANGHIRLAIKSRSLTYTEPEIDMASPIDSVTVLTQFPSVAIKARGSKFKIKVPAQGLVVVEVALSSD